MLKHLIMLYGLISLTTLLIDKGIILPQDQKYGNKQVSACMYAYIHMYIHAYICMYVHKINFIGYDMFSDCLYLLAFQCSYI